MISGIGVDIVSIHRIERVVMRWGERFLRRIFSHDELAYAMQKTNPYISLAGMFAAKEACAKALGCGIGSISWLDMCVERDKKGRPFLSMAEYLLQKITGVSEARMHLTISHDSDNAIAVVVLESFNHVP
ncbi:MAG: holo-ACP synthase [Dissulfuribacterales bacterium]